MEDGRRHVGEFLFAGDLFGLDTLDRHDFGAEAVTPVTLRRYARRDLEQLADQDRGVARRLRELSSNRLRSGREHMVLLGRKTASERIASFLLEIAERAGPEPKSLDRTAHEPRRHGRLSGSDHRNGLPPADAPASGRDDRDRRYQGRDPRSAGAWRRGVRAVCPLTTAGPGRLSGTAGRGRTRFGAWIGAEPHSPGI